MKKLILSLVLLLFASPLWAQCSCPTGSQCMVRRVTDNVGKQAWLFFYYYDPTPGQGEQSAYDQYVRWIEVALAAQQAFEQTSDSWPGRWEEPFTYDNKGVTCLDGLYYWNLPNDTVTNVGP